MIISLSSLKSPFNNSLFLSSFKANIIYNKKKDTNERYYWKRVVY